MKKISDILQITIFIFFILGFMVMAFVMPDKEFSQQENRSLAGMPQFTVEGLKSGKLMKEIENYLTDQFPFRDSWIAMKSNGEKAMGKTENNNVFFGKDGVLVERFDGLNEVLIERNVSAVNKLAESTDLPVYFSLIPGAVSIWENKLPANAQNESQKEMIHKIYEKVSCTTVDNYSVLEEHQQEYIFYKTDHHWTTLGAYYGYTAVTDAMGMMPGNLQDYAVETVSDDFYGTVYSSSGVRWVEPDRIDKYVTLEGKHVEKIAGTEVSKGVLYDYDKLKVKDKYAFFFGGNTPLLKITSECKNGNSLLVIRDSYSDSEIPFLTEHFSEIYMMDLRYYKLGVSRFLEEHKVDAVLINYSVANFCKDANIVMMGS